MSKNSEDLFLSIAEKMGLKEEDKRAAASLVLLNPDLLTAQYAKSKSLASEAEDYVKKGNLPVARSRFANASKLALYEGDLDSAKKYLQKTVDIDKNYPGLSTALREFESVSKFVVEFYRNKYGSVASK